MHVPINVKSSNNISKWQMEFNSAFKGLKCLCYRDGLFRIRVFIHVFVGNEVLALWHIINSVFYATSV
jgi:hypothetical protein